MHELGHWLSHWTYQDGYNWSIGSFKSMLSLKTGGVNCNIPLSSCLIGSEYLLKTQKNKDMIKKIFLKIKPEQLLVP
jgi:hypothetical protein